MRTGNLIGTGTLSSTTMRNLDIFLKPSDMVQSRTMQYRRVSPGQALSVLSFRMATRWIYLRKLAR